MCMAGVLTQGAGDLCGRIGADGAACAGDGDGHPPDGAAHGLGAGERARCSRALYLWAAASGGRHLLAAQRQVDNVCAPAEDQ